MLLDMTFKTPVSYIKAYRKHCIHLDSNKIEINGIERGASLQYINCVER